MAPLTAAAAGYVDAATGPGDSIAGRSARLVVLCSLCAPLLCGCAAAAGYLAGQVIGGLVVGGVVAATNLGSEAGPQDLAVTGMDGSPIDYPINAVYLGLISVAEADGRKIVATDGATYNVRVSYPFSLVHNNWGGEITVTCVVDGYGTRVLFEHDGQDATARVKKIEASMLDDMLQWLRQRASVSHPDAAVTGSALTSHAPLALSRLMGLQRVDCERECQHLVGGAAPVPFPAGLGSAHATTWSPSAVLGMPDAAELASNGVVAGMCMPTRRSPVGELRGGLCLATHQP